MSLKDRLKEARKNNGKTQKEMSELLGIKPSTYSGYETGYSEPNMSILASIIDILNCDANYLLQDEINKKDSVKLSNQEKALINKYRQLNEQQQYEVMGYIDGKLNHTDTVKESTPVYKIENNTHLKVAENEYEYKGERYIKTDVAAYGATEDETMIADIEKFKIADKKMQESIDEDIRKQKEYEEGVIKRVMKRHNISREEAIKLIKNL